LTLPLDFVTVLHESPGATARIAPRTPDQRPGGSVTLETILLDEILPRVEKPSRYLGNELNTVRKERRPGDLRFALAFPDLYDVGLSNLGILILYNILNGMDGVVAERSYAPGMDLEMQLRQRGLPIFSLETKTPLAEFDAIGFSIQYELAATNILTMLDLAGIPLRAEDRRDRDPIIFAGGPGGRPRCVTEVGMANENGDRLAASRERIEALGGYL
jgi:hypothetical protein